MFTLGYDTANTGAYLNKFTVVVRTSYLLFHVRTSCRPECRPFRSRPLPRTVKLETLARKTLANPDPKNFGEINVGETLTLKSASIIIIFKLNSDGAEI